MLHFTPSILANNVEYVTDKNTYFNMTNSIMDGGFEYLRPYLTGINLNKITKNNSDPEIECKICTVKDILLTI